MKYAETQPYWSTTVNPGNSQGEVLELLDKFGASKVITMTGQVAGKGGAWVIRFEYEGKVYRFLFKPLICEYPLKSYSFPDKSRRTGEKQALYQMGRRAVNMVKAVLSAAEDNPDALFGFMEMSWAGTPGQLAPTSAEVGTEGLSDRLPEIRISNPYQLEEGE